MRLRARVDSNQREVVKALRRCGASVEILSRVGAGCPDLLVGFGGKNFLFEVKDGDKSPSGRKLTEHEKQWHEDWRGTVYVVESAEEAIELLTYGIYKP